MIFNLHKRAFLAGLLVVMMWFLVSVPGVRVSGAGTTGMSITIFEHGWPFVFYTSSRVHVTKVFFQLNQSGSTTDELAESYLSRYEHLSQSLRLDLRFRFAKLQYSNYGFWSVPNLWPIPKPGRAFHVNWTGLAANLAFALLVFMGTVGGLELLIRCWPEFLILRTGYSLGALLVVVLLSSLIALHWKKIRTNERQVENLERVKLFVDNWDDGYISFDWDEFSSSSTRKEKTHRLPLLISNLFDNRLHRLFYSERYQTPQKVEVILWDGFKLPSSSREGKELIESWNKLQVPVEFAAGQTEFTNELLEFFNLTDGSNIRHLELNLQDYFEDSDNQSAWKTNSPLAAKFKDLQELSLVLSYELDTATQLKPFMMLPQVDKFHIRWVDETAIRELLESKLPMSIDIDFDYCEGKFSAALIREFEERFNLEKDDREYLIREIGVN